MLSLARDGYTADAVKAALLASHRQWRFGFELLDSSNEALGWLPGVSEAEVEYNFLADIKRTMRFEVLDNNDVNWIRDRVKPHVYLTMPDGGEVDFPQGVLLMATPNRSTSDLSQRVIRDVEAYDQLLVLHDDKEEDRYTVTAGTNYISAVETLLSAAGIVSQNLTPTDKTLPATRDWDPGVSKLKIINDLLVAINYESLFFDEEGFAVARPYTNPSDKASEITYATNEDSIILPDADYEFDLFGVPNKWVLVVSQPDRPVLTSTYTNSSADSPTSTVSRGRTIVDFRDREDAADQTSLDARAKRLAESASQIYESVEFTTGLMPIHQHADVYTLTHSALGVSAKFSEHRWSMPLEVGAEMDHRIRRVVTV